MWLQDSLVVFSLGSEPAPSAETSSDKKKLLKFRPVSAELLSVETETLGRPALESLVENFDRDAAAGKIRIRELLEQDPQSFQQGVVRLIKSPPSSLRGVHYTVSLLVANNLLLLTLCDQALNLSQAATLARMALQLDPMMDVALAKKLADATALGEPLPNAGRLMDILGEISAGNRITSSLMRLWRSSDPQMRSKAVLLIGRSSRSIQWAQSRLAEIDPRIRANAVEALWGLDTAEAKVVLRAAAGDCNNRVAGNALFALYAMGDTTSISDLLKMAASDSPQFRSSAAWAMGETGDPRFSETLGRLMSESSSFVRKRAFAELSRLKAAAKARQGREWRVAARLLPVSGSMRQFGFEASPPDGGAAPLLLPTRFILSEDGQPVTQYQVEAYVPPEALALTFLFPHSASPDSPAIGPPWLQGAIGCLNWKRPSDQWCATFYLPADDKPAEKAQGTPNPPQFTADVQAALVALQEAPAKTACASFWDAIRNSAQATGAPERGARHLIVYNLSSPAAPASLPEIVAAAVASKTSVHVVSLAPCPPLEELCRGTQGSFRQAKSEPALLRLVEEAHMALLPRFLVGYPPVAPGARMLNVRVFDATGWGEATIQL